jgi:DNA (cytosine-5)-methyltransferase 1
MNPTPGATVTRPLSTVRPSSCLGRYEDEGDEGDGYGDEPVEPAPTCIELFAGAGGAALGLHRAGYRSLARCEWDADACRTLRAAFPSDTVIEGDVRAVDWSPYAGRCDLLWASPPCQAWSSAGKRLGARDERNGWPWTFVAADAIRPTWMVCENVPGLLQHSADAGCDREGSDPTRCPGCYWLGVILPAARERFAHVSVLRLDAADYGVPQRRHRVFLVCGPAAVETPAPAHSEAALIFAKWRDGGYWRRHGIAPVGEPSEADRKMLGMMFAPGRGLLPWRTVRDDLTDEPSTTVAAVSGEGTVYASRSVDDRTLPLDAPAFTLRAQGGVDASGHEGGHASVYVRDSDRHPPSTLDAPAVGIRSGGDGHSAPAAMLATPGLRRLTTSECATLQDFPAAHPFQRGAPDVGAGGGDVGDCSEEDDGVE